MGKLDEDIFDAVVEIVSAAVEETELDICAESGDKVADFFIAVYKRLYSFAEGAEAPAKPGAFEVYKDAADEYRFRLKAANGETIAVSEGYAKKSGCLKGVESVRKNALTALLREE